MQFSESICIIDVDVDHYKNILDYLDMSIIWVIFFSKNIYSLLLL